MSELLADLARNGGTGARVAVVAAHPDDEILGLGSRLGGMSRLKIIHLTDGAPRDLADARRAGFPACAEYAAARRREFASALAAAGAGHAETSCHGHPDQEAILACGPILARLADELAGMDAVLTHPYEHGHPDHDTAAVVVALACAELEARDGDGPERYEFASYHLRAGRPVLGRFWPEPSSPETVFRLCGEALERKRAAVACYASQERVTGGFPVAEERLRRAPRYDFHAPAPPGRALYDQYGWAMTSRRWRQQAARVVSPPGSGVAA